jgi:hypothetical protein
VLPLGLLRRQVHNREKWADGLTVSEHLLVVERQQRTDCHYRVGSALGQRESGSYLIFRKVFT